VARRVSHRKAETQVIKCDITNEGKFFDYCAETFVGSAPKKQWWETETAKDKEAGKEAEDDYGLCGCFRFLRVGFDRYMDVSAFFEAYVLPFFIL